MDDVVSSALSRQRFNTLALGVFAVAALLLAGIGLYGVMSYLIAQRTREFGIRIALGERPQRVRTLVLGQSVSIAAAGLAAGLILSAVLSRAMKSLLYGIAPLDLPTYAAITAVLLTVAMLAAYAPARRATKIDPVAALRG
jgi:ABC-type antimicrobial peptide transport system permease subunit